jgi:copper chaperone NosL
MKTLKLTLTLLSIGLFSGCAVGPQPIEYGSDGCYFCKMTIVDKTHGAEIVTNKGKVYKFDAAECMINSLDEFEAEEIALYLTNIYSEPETLIDATRSTFLISENVPSPMGAFLTAFKSEKDAVEIMNSKGGTIYNWEEIIKHLKQ